MTRLFWVCCATGASMLLLGCGDPSGSESVGRRIDRQIARPAQLEQRAALRAHLTRIVAGEPKTRGRRAIPRAQIERVRATVSNRLSRNIRDLPVDASPAGTKRVDLNGRLGSAHIAHRRADGSYETTCVTSHAEFDALIEKLGAEK